MCGEGASVSEASALLAGGLGLTAGMGDEHDSTSSVLTDDPFV